MLHKEINIRLSQTYLAVYRKGVTTFGIKVFNNLPPPTLKTSHFASNSKI
jgi:hypothetical protein